MEQGAGFGQKDKIISSDRKKGEEPGYALPLKRRNLEIVYWFN
jgi:hypothetical protein